MKLTFVKYFLFNMKLTKYVTYTLILGYLISHKYSLKIKIQFQDTKIPQ